MKTFVLAFVVSYASAQVVIPDSVARFFLQRNDVAYQLEKRDSLFTKAIETYEKELQNKNLIISSYRSDYDVLKKNADLLIKESKDVAKQNGELLNLLAKEKTKFQWSLVAVIVALIL